MSTILISGAASGLGLAFLKAYAQEPNSIIIAVDKDPVPIDDIKASQPGQKLAKLITHRVDVTSQSSVDELASKLPAGMPIDLVIQSAGVRGLVPSIEDAKPDDVAACETLAGMDLDTLLRTFHINAAGTFMLIRALVPNMRHSPTAKVVIMSSRMGSMSNNTAGGAYAYRASKAALNSIVKSLSLDLPEITFVLCHPGRVSTNLVKCKEEGAITAEESVEGLLPIVARWKEEDSGKFYDRFGEPIEW